VLLDEATAGKKKKLKGPSKYPDALYIFNASLKQKFLEINNIKKKVWMKKNNKMQIKSIYQGHISKLELSRSESELWCLPNSRTLASSTMTTAV
jgi:hypothetical protein